MRRSIVLRSGLVMAILWATLALASDYTTIYTTIPSYPVTVSGRNSGGQSASWEDGGHVRVATTVIDYYPLGPANDVKFFYFSTHDNTVCDATSATAHTLYQRIKLLSGINQSGDQVPVWHAQRLYLDGTMQGTTTTVQWVFTSNGQEAELNSTPDPNPMQAPAASTLQYKVGTWQGDQLAYVTTAATPGL